jgi:hypothetical protein
MRISFSSTIIANAAVNILEQYGFLTTQTGSDVLTNCPTLLAAPAIERGIGLETGRADRFVGPPRLGGSATQHLGLFHRAN